MAIYLKLTGDWPIDFRWAIYIWQELRLAASEKVRANLSIRREKSFEKQSTPHKHYRAAQSVGIREDILQMNKTMNQLNLMETIYEKREKGKIVQWKRDFMTSGGCYNKIFKNVLKWMSVSDGYLRSKYNSIVFINMRHSQFVICLQKLLSRIINSTRYHVTHITVNI